MSGLHELLAQAARAALPTQRPDGSFPAGRNGPYGDPETPVRNTSHWLVTLCAVLRRDPDPALRDAALAAARYLASDKARPGGATFFHRDVPGKDACNGLVGQAWSIEALAEAACAFDAPQLSELAQQVFLLHPFDADTGLWKRVDVDGSPLTWDATFNHQLWFAAAGARLAPLVSTEVSARVGRFLEKLASHLAVDACGRVRHLVSPRGFVWHEPRLALRLWRTRAGEGGAEAHKEAGYHAFNLHGLALLRRHAPDHPFWRGRGFARAWRYAHGGAFREALDANVYAWPYNPCGIEMAFALETLEGPGARPEAERWLGEQLRRHWDPQARALRRDTPDPETLAARLCEAAVLPDLALPDGVLEGLLEPSER